MKCSRLSIGAAAALLGVALAARADYLPGGAETAKAVEARRGKTELSRLAARMKPGEVAELKTRMPDGLWGSPKVGGGRNAGGEGGLHIAGWTDDAHWDSRTGQFLYMGLRQTRRFIAYSEQDNSWRTIELDLKSDNPCARSKIGHIYSSNGYDPERSRFFHRYNSYQNKKEGLDLQGGISYFDILSEEWTKLPPVPSEAGFTGMAIEYSTALDGLVILGKRAYIHRTASNKWEDLGASPVSGYHSLIRHNPYRSELLMGGGNHNPRTVARITKGGKIERLKDFPCDISVGGDRFMVDPQSGRYLIYAGPKGEARMLYEFDSDENEYRVVEEFKFPYTKYSMPVMTFIPEYGVVMFAEQRCFLYKHDFSAKHPVAEAIQEQIGQKEPGAAKMDRTQTHVN
jgi:hypothetical protein